MPPSTSSPWRIPSLSGSPTGRTPQDRSRVPQQWSQAVQGLEHLDPDRADGQVGAVGQRLGTAHDVLVVPAAHVDEGVDHSQVGVMAHPEDREPLRR